MEGKLQELTERLYNEGVHKAEEEARAIVEEARKSRDAILGEAQRKAEETLAQSNKRAGEILARGKTDLRRAARQAEENLRHPLIYQCLPYPPYH